MQLSFLDALASPLRPPPPDPDEPAHRWRRQACEAKRACLPWPSWIRVACPECGAPVGQPCTLRSGELLSPDPWVSLHHARSSVAYALRVEEAYRAEHEAWRLAHRLDSPPWQRAEEDRWPGLRWLLGEDEAAWEMILGWVPWPGMPAEVEA